MYLTYKRGRALAAGLAAKPRSLFAPVRQELRAFPSVCAALGHINNARYLDLASLGRLTWFARSGLAPQLFRERYRFLIVGAAVTYRREIPCWAPFFLETRLVEYDERWVCFLCSFELAQAPGVSTPRVAARVLTRGQLRKRAGTGSLPSLLSASGRVVEPCPPLPEDVAEQLKVQDLTVDVIRRQEGR